MVIDKSQQNGMFLGEMHRHMSHEEEQKNFFSYRLKVFPLSYFIIWLLLAA